MIAPIGPRVGVNAAFFRELKEDDPDLLSLVSRLERAASASRPGAERLLRAADLADRMRRKLASRFELEETFGYFERPRDVSAAVCDAAAVLRAEHCALYDEICELADALAYLAWSAASENINCDAEFFAMADFCNSLRRHEEEEDALIAVAWENHVPRLAEDVTPVAGPAFAAR
ncbi:MAG: hypothetical protein KY475_21630 [Planctomycetes bacterium]|nr:hypothetical protein [Planctomycetota bacterium]